LSKDKILFIINPLVYTNNYILEQLTQDSDFIVADYDEYNYSINDDKFELGICLNNEYIDIENFKNIVVYSKPHNFNLFLEKINNNNINLLNRNFLNSKNYNLINNKVNQHLFFKKNNITFLGISNDFLIENKDDVIFKMKAGSFGEGICLPKDKNESKFKYTMNKHNTFLEKFISNKKDYRVMLVNKKSLGVVFKENQNNKIINFYSGAVFHKVDFIEIEQIAEKICNLLDLDYCAVDFIVDNDTKKIYVLEINFFAKFEGFESIYGKNLVLNKIKEYFYNK
jgi:glutathione synthase/RimK-type ligase-like ATP-grasp enzyme